jgi:hypothetical protein
MISGIPRSSISSVVINWNPTDWSCSISTIPCPLSMHLTLILHSKWMTYRHLTANTSMNAGIWYESLPLGNGKESSMIDVSSLRISIRWPGI